MTSQTHPRFSEDMADGIKVIQHNCDKINWFFLLLNTFGKQWDIDGDIVDGIGDVKRRRKEEKEKTVEI